MISQVGQHLFLISHISNDLNSVLVFTFHCFLLSPFSMFERNESVIRCLFDVLKYNIKSVLNDLSLKINCKSSKSRSPANPAVSKWAREFYIIIISFETAGFAGLRDFIRCRIITVKITVTIPPYLKNSEKWKLVQCFGRFTVW